MKNVMLRVYLVISCFLLGTVCCFSQKGTVSGVLASEGQPLPGVNIIIKGKSIGTQTDFDGKYRIDCNVGDVLVFSYIGFSSKEVQVTARMFGENTTIAIEKPVKTITNEAYTKAVKNMKNSMSGILDIVENPTHLHDLQRNYFYGDRIKNITIDSDKVHVEDFGSEIYYEIGFDQRIIHQFVQNKNLHQLQSTYAQGRPDNGGFSWFGAEVGEPFSFGPKLNNLAYDGMPYRFDTRGRLVPLGSGNGQQPMAMRETLFNAMTNTASSLSLGVRSNEKSIKLNVGHSNRKGVFGFGKQLINELDIGYEELEYDKKMQWRAFLKYTNTDEKQPNTNGFYNNVIKSHFLTPISFDNTQGYQFVDGSQRSFSPEENNNPLWLLNTNQNQQTSNLFVASVQNKIQLGENTKLTPKLSYVRNENSNVFGFPKGTVGFVDGYLGDKSIAQQSINYDMDFSWKFYGKERKSEVTSTIGYQHQDLFYKLLEQDIMNPTTRVHEAQRNTLRMYNKFCYEVFPEMDAELTLANNSYVSSIQQTRLFQPKIKFSIDLQEVFDTGNWLNNFTLTAATAFSANETPLLYTNSSHSSLVLLPEESASYTANDELFVTNDLQLEDVQNFELGADLRIFIRGKNLNFGVTSYQKKIANSVFPIITANGFELQNVATIQNNGLEATFSTRIGGYDRFSYAPEITFSSYRNKALALNTTEDRVPIAGFATTSKNLIVGQPAGVLVGTAYARDTQNTIIVGPDGFPMVASQKQVIGDPNPDFTIGFSNTFRWKELSFEVLLDIRKGGDVWNGTQQVLNYHGVSEETALLRNTTDFIFEGVTSGGTRNSVPVAFASPNNEVTTNRWVRYGYEGVAEDAIVDGSYINLRSMSLSYNFSKNYRDEFFREFKVGLYANNLFTYTKYKGASPYHGLFDTNSGEGLQYFNTPLLSEIGFTINIKI